MKIFLGNRQSLKCYYLPERIEESYLVNYRSLVDNEDKMISIMAIDGKWHIKSNLSIGLLSNNKPKDEIELEEYREYSIKFNDCDETISLYCLPSKNEKYKDYELANNILNIGQDTNCDIVYTNKLIDDKLVEITINNDGIGILKTINDNSFVYVNGLACNKKELYFGDTIFLYGLKIIWMKDFIRVSDFSKVKVQLSTYSLKKEDNTNYKDATSRERSASLYKENDYFVHKPVNKPKVEHKIITLDSPSNREGKNQTTVFITIGFFIILAVVLLSSGLTSIINIINGKSEFKDETVSLVLCGIMMICALLFPAIIGWWDKKESKRKDNIRLRKYQEYLKSKKKDIKLTIDKQSKSLKELYCSPSECYKMIMNRQDNMWSREITDDEFLNIRFGVGNIDADIEIDAQKLGFTIDDNAIKNKINELQDTALTMDNVPIISSLTDNMVFATILETNNKKNYINGIMLQLMAYYSSNDLKIVFLVNKKNNLIWDEYRCLAHTISDDKNIRFLAYEDDDIKNVSSYLEDIYEDRFNSINKSNNNGKDYYKNFEEYYLIITDDIVHLKNIGIISNILNIQNNYGFSLLVFDQSLNNIPNGCKHYAYIKDVEAEMVSEEISGKVVKSFKPEYVNDINMNNLIYKVSNIPVVKNDGSSILPSSLDFLDMYRVGRIEQLNILGRWFNNDPTNSLKTPVGVYPNGDILELDLHEKYDGPNGLIVGYGKTELLTTYILSMCINYNPNEVQFVLIDYKDGKLIEAFKNKDKKKKSSHLVGVLDNLDDSEINRVLISINNELEIREELFDEVKEKTGDSIIDIYKYQSYYREGKLKEPLAHLFIVIDEFLELKDLRSDFITELLAMADRGKKAGIHLIFATQNPKIVDKQMIDSMNFKICLKVDSISDSKKIINRVDAASIKESGRFYLQVGNIDNPKIAQGALTNCNYVPMDSFVKKIDDTINFISDSGTIIKSINNIVRKEESDKGNQLTNIVNYLIDLSSKEKYDIEDLWLPSIPEEVFLGNLINKYKFKAKAYDFTTIVGEYDDPEYQEQGLLSVNLRESGNIILYGVPGCGKANQIATMLYTMCIYHNHHEFNAYIIDSKEEVFSSFNTMPQVKEYINVYEEDKVNSLLEKLEEEYKYRKRILGGYSGSFEAYNKVSSIGMSLITVIINDIESLINNNKELEDRFNILFEESNRVGMMFITSATSQNVVSNKVIQNFNTIYGLKFADPFDYRYVLNAQAGVLPKNCYGRGLTKIDDRVLEYQTAFINVYEIINKTIRDTADSLNKHNKK